MTSREAVSVGFAGDGMIQFVNEALQSVEVCLNLSQVELQREVIVNVSSNEATASGKSFPYCTYCHNVLLIFSIVSDYQPIDVLELVFSPDTDSQQCFNVTIVDDSILEGTEIFHLSILPSNDLAVIPQNSILSVGIENDDSKMIFTQSFNNQSPFNISGVNVSFGTTDFFVNETMMFEVCVVLTGSIEINVTVILSSEEISDSFDASKANSELPLYNDYLMHNNISNSWI